MKKPKVSKINRKKLGDLLQRSLVDTAIELGEVMKDVIQDPNAFPAFPDQDIVDTGALLRSQSVTIKKNSVTYDWNAPYAIYVHEGYTLKNGSSQLARPWTVVAVQRYGLARGIQNNLFTFLKSGKK